MEGYIQLHRQILDSAVFANPNYLKIWLWILIKANHKDKEVPIKIGGGSSTIAVKRGEFLFGRNSSSEELCMSGSMIYRTLKKFEKWKMITIKSNNQYSVITICNYDTYQSTINTERTTDELDLNQTRTRRELDVNTTNNDNNDNNDNKKSILVATDSDESISTEAMEVAKYLYESIKKWDASHKYNRTKPALKSWANDIDKAIRIDGRDAESLKHMIHYLFNEKTQTAIFWSPNIQSGKTLREKFDTVKQKANHEHTQRRNNGKSTYKQNSQSVIDALEIYYGAENEI
jgi:hypothetical protein